MPHASSSPPPAVNSWPSSTGGQPDSMLPSQRGDPYLEPTQFDSESLSAFDLRERVPSYDLQRPASYRDDDFLYQGPSLGDSTGRRTFSRGGPRRSSSFGTLTSPLPFGVNSPSSSLPYDDSLLARSRPGSASATSDMPAGSSKPPNTLLPPAGYDDFGSRRTSQEDLWSSRTRWMTEQGMYRDPLDDDALAVEELSPSYFMQSSGGSNPFSPTMSSLRRSTSTYSMSSSHRSAQAGPYARPTTPTSRGESSARRRSITSDQESASPSKRSSPRKVAQVTTVLDPSGSPTKSIRRIAKLNLDASPSKPESSSSPRKSPRKNSRGAVATGNVPIRPAPDTTLSESSVREVEQILGEIGPVLEPAPLGGGESANKAPRRVSFASSAVRQARVPSVLLPPAPIDVSMSRVALEQEFVDDPDALERIDLPPHHAPFGRTWRSSIDLPTPPKQFPESPYASDDYYRPQTQAYPPAHYPVREGNPAVSSFVLPANPHARSQPAFSHEYATYATGLAVPASPFPPQDWSDGRRRSSASSYEYVPASVRRYPVPATSMWSTGMPMHADYESGPPSYQDPRMYRLPAYGSSSASSSSPSPTSDSRPATPPPISRITPIPITPKGGSPTKASAGSAKGSPGKKKRSPAKGKRQLGAMFVNYSAVDAVSAPVSIGPPAHC